MPNVFRESEDVLGAFISTQFKFLSWSAGSRVPVVALGFDGSKWKSSRVEKLA